MHHHDHHGHGAAELEHLPTDTTGLPRRGDRSSSSSPTATSSIPRSHPWQIPVGETFTYEITVPDPGAYRYHPHIREDYGQELGLYGCILVDPADPE